jgi:TPR repeat protein
LKYLQFASYSSEVEQEASLKIAEFFYHGISGQKDYKNAMALYKQVEDSTSQPEIKSHALFKLGMMH